MSNVVVIEGLTIRQDAEGRYCLNDLHKASGGEEKDSPNRFTRSDVFISLVNELTPEMAFAPYKSQRGGLTSGTYVVKELVYAYAMWISPAFNLKVIRAFDTLQTQGVAVADHAAEELLNDPLAFMEKLFAQAKKIQAERDVLKGKLAVAEKELNLVTVDEYRALTHRYMPHGQKVRLGRKAAEIMREMGMTVEKQERVLGERICSVNVYPRHILEKAEQR